MTLEPLEEGRAWACLAATGPSAHITGLRARGGGEGTDGLRRFKGMISLYGCAQVELVDCWFGENLRGDDAVNIAEGQARVVGCTFEGARSDALDLDLVRGVVERCRFVGAGNDGLDLSLSRVTVSGCVFERCGDKGVSVGEGSRLLLRDAQVRGCTYGVELKDACAALLEDCALEDNGVGVHAYRKKWVFRAGGAGALVRTRVRGSRAADVSLEDRTTLWLVASEAPRPGYGAERARVVDAVPPSFLELFAPLEAAR